MKRIIFGWGLAAWTIFGVMSTARGEAETGGEEIAVLRAKNGKHAREFVSPFAELGLKEAPYFDTDESFAEFSRNLERYELVLVAPLFTYFEKDFRPDVTALRRWIENGGVLVVTDASYDGVRAFVAAIDKGLGGLSTGKCTSTPWQVHGYTANVEPVDVLRSFPNRLSNADSWPHFDEPGRDSRWRVITRCSEGKPVIFLAEFGKGAVVLSAMRQTAPQAIENFLAYARLRKSGLAVKEFSLTPVAPGAGSVEMKLAADAPAGTKLVLELAPVEGSDDSSAQRIEVPFTGAVGAKDYKLVKRGVARWNIAIENAAGRQLISSRAVTLPHLLEVGPNAYRGLLSTARRVQDVKFPVRFAPIDERLGGAALKLEVSDATGVVASAEFKLPAEQAGGETWYAVKMPGVKAVGEYRVTATLDKPEAGLVAVTASAPFEIVAPREAQCVIDEDQTFLVNGKPFFPLGLYHVKPQFYEELKDIGFNTVQFWSWDWGGDAYGAPTSMYRALGNGLRCLFESNYHFERLYRDQARNFANNGGLLMWYLADEPDESMAKELGDRRRWRREMDPNHPTFVASCRPDLFKYHASFADVFAMDPYFNEKETEKYLDWCTRAQKEILPHQPVVVVPWADSDPELIRWQAWTAIVHGARGLIWYCWNQVGGGPRGVGIHSKPELKPVYKELIAQIKSVQGGLTATNRRYFEQGEVHGLEGGGGRRGRFLILVNVNRSEARDYQVEPAMLRHEKTVFLPQKTVEKRDADGRPVLDKQGRPAMDYEMLTLEKPGRLQGTLAPGETKLFCW